MPDYDDVAQDYEDRVVPRYRPIAEEVIRRARLRAGERVLEVGAGTGLLTRLLAPTDVDLLVTDISHAMLTLARKCLVNAAAPIPPTLVASVASLPLASGRFDAIVASLTPLQDSSAALREARRVLGPRGRISLSMWGPSYSEVRLNNVALRAAGKRHLPYGAPRKAVERMRRLGFTIDRKDEHFDVEYENRDSYLQYRRAFGLPADWTAADKEAYFLALGDLIDRRAEGASVRFDWNITYLTATLDDKPVKSKRQCHSCI